jgi:hypothetical protein
MASNQESDWTHNALVRETIANFESLQGVYGVEWAEQSLYETFQALIKVRTWKNGTVRLAIHYVEDEDEEEVFDDSFS